MKGLDLNVWFRNVELVTSRIVGQQTVQYASNIYKYYVAYELPPRTIRAHEMSAAHPKLGRLATKRQFTKFVIATCQLRTLSDRMDFGGAHSTVNFDNCNW